MLRHEFQPGRLFTGAPLAAAGVLFAGDAAGAWTTPWWVIVPIVGGGLCLGAVTGLLASVARAIRSRRAAHRGPHGGQDGVTAPQPRGAG
ncbi:hypothetical protein ACIHAA_19590 [Streptomyces sp. NPDC052040]|uniref:hypothetical protein n=1 Tax=Streptomyces sp. NPDC052040 TaxID=3365682 RepID=UPI0037CF7DB9